MTALLLVLFLQNVNPAIVVASCGNQTLTAGNRATLTVGADGKLCIASISVSVDTTGLATSGKQDTANTSLSSMDTKLSNLDVASSTLAKDSSLTTLNAKDFATSAKQDTGNSSLSTIAAKDFATAANQTTGNSSLGTITTNTAIPTTVAVTTIDVAPRSQTLLASNSTRKSATIYNDGYAPLLVKLGSYVTYNDYTLRIDPHSSQTLPGYTGAIYGIWLPPIEPHLLHEARITEISQ